MGFKQALAIGTAQAAALIPGISRSGITMGGGLMTGLSNDDAARYAFLLATPIIGAAGLLKLPDLLGLGRRRRPRPGAGRRDRRRRHHLLRGQVPAALLRDQPAHPVRHLLHRRRPHLHPHLRPLMLGFWLGHGLATAAAAWYASFAAVTNSTFGRTVLPVRPPGR